MYLLLIAIIYLAFVSLGLPDSLLGAGWPAMHNFFDVPITYMGIVSMIISGGTILSSLFSERITKKLTAKYVVSLSTMITALALFGFSFATKFWMICLLAIPYGLGAGAIDAALNNYVALHYSSKHMSWLHCFWGLGTIISPYVVSFALTYLDWTGGFRIIGTIQTIIVVVLFATIPLWRVNQNKNEEEGIAPIIGLKKSLKIKGVPYLLTGFFAYCAAEATVMLWLSSYFVEIRMFPKETAAALSALFFIGLTVGRFIAGFVTDGVGDKQMIRLGTSVAFVGLIFALMPNSYAAFVGFMLFGLGCAPIYPCIIHATPNNFGEENSQAIIGIQMASAYTGSTFSPPIFGILASGVSMNLLPIYCGMFFVLMIIMIEKTWVSTKVKKE